MSKDGPPTGVVRAVAEPGIAFVGVLETDIEIANGLATELVDQLE